MAWKIEFHPDAEKEFGRLDHTTQRLVVNYLRKRIMPCDDPRQFGKPLVGNKAGLWRYRVDKYRIICHLEDHKMVVLIVRVAKRDALYDA